jgi:hypothetical protein
MQRNLPCAWLVRHDHGGVLTTKLLQSLEQGREERLVTAAHHVCEMSTAKASIIQEIDEFVFGEKHLE